MTLPSENPTPPARLPLTGAQTGVWFAQQLAPDDPRYNTAEYTDIRGPLDPGLLAGAIGAAVAEAGALTAGFGEEDGRPWQAPGLASPGEVPVVDLRDEPDPASAARSVMRADLARPASLTRDPGRLVADTVFRLGEDRFWWYQRRHHIVLDGFGYALTARRAAEIYTARAREAEPRPAWFGPLAAVLDEEARYRSSGDIAADREYWRDVLADRAEPAGLPGLSGPAGCPLRDQASLPEELADGLARTARRCGTTWPQVLMAALAVYLNRTAGSDDVLLAIPMMGRTGPAARVPAMIANVLPLRVPVSPRVPFDEIVQRVGRGLEGMRAHQRYRGEDIRRDLGLVGPGRAGDGPLVNVIPFASALRFGPARGVPRQVAAGPSDHLSVTLHGTGTAPGDIVFDARDDDDPSILAAHLERFTALLSRIAAGDPAEPSGRLSVLRPDERRALLPAAPGAGAVPDSGESEHGTLPARFEEQARRSPHAPALTCDGETLTYRDLNRRANRLAHALIARGAGPERVIALLLPRSADLVAAILAVLKTGAAYLPLDPAYPADRLAAMAEDAGPLFVLASREAGPGDSPLSVPYVRLGDLAGPDDGRDRDPTDADRSSPLRPDNAAYIIYTSGSTGTPKGTVVSHRNAVRLLTVAGPRFGFGPRDVWTLFHSYAFDFSVWEIWGSLLHGGRLVVVPHGTARTPAEFWRLLRDEGVTVLNQTPEAFYSLITAGMPDAGPDPADDPPLRWIIFGGDALDTTRLGPWWKRHAGGGPGLVNMYGITETTVHVTRLDLPSGSSAPDRGAGSPVGDPLPDLRVYLLDDALQPVPAGATGEIYVSGPGVTRGYLGRPGLTAQRFTANPFGPPGDRLYRTGDLGRRRPGGGLEHLGRADRQVKVRGFRVEPAEIEAALRQHPCVARAAVVLREDGPGGSRLAAYVARSSPDHGDLPRELDRHLRRLLPAHMVPSAIIELDALPQGPSGKPDPRLLPAVTPDVAGTGRAPRTPVEEIVCELVADVLAVPRVGLDDDFFALGGHSLLAARLIWRIRSSAGAELSIRDVFDNPTPAGLAGLLSQKSAAASVPPRLAPLPGPRPARLPLSPAQRRLWFLQRLEGPLASYNLPLAFRLSGPVDIAALEAALGDVTARHEILRTVFPDADGEPYQLVREADEARPALQVTDTAEAALDRQLAATARLGFDLAAEPPVRVRLFRLPEDSHILALTLHHIAGDEWSLAPLASDLSAAYRARVMGRAPEWRPLPVQYGDYATWQRDLLGDDGDAGPSALADQQLAFWRRELDGLPDHLELPADHPRPAATSYRGGTVPVTVGPRTHVRLRALAREHGATLSMVTQAAVAALLTRLGAGADVPLGTPVAGRPDEALGDAIGFFVNTLVLRADTSGNPAFTDLLRQTRERGLAAYSRADLPFDRLVEALNPPRSPGRHPLFQVMVTYRNTATATLDLPGVTAAGHTLSTGTAKFDLTVSLGPRADGEGDGLDGFLEYNADLFEPATAASVAGRLTRLLDAVARTPDRPIGQLDLLAPAERGTILRDWNDTAAPVPPASLPEMIAAHAERFPGREAVTDGRVRLTYAELDRRANWLARRLRDAGAGPETMVGACLDRSPEMVTALLAVLKTGAAFVPFDPSWPASRVTGIAASARLTAMLTPAGADRDWPGLNAPVIEVESAASWAPSHASADTLMVRPDPENLAYVIYTSGSTGVPKGAMIRHEAISNRLPWQAGLLGLTPGDAVLHKAPLTFDISVNEIFLPLSAGARLVLAEPGRDGDVGHLLDLIRRERVTFAYLVSTILSLMLERPDAGEAAKSLRHLWCGGEVLTPELYRRFRDRLPDTTMYHGYGPAEATIGVSCQVYSPATASGGRITIGRPNPNTRVYLLDEYLNPVPPGVPGELYLGGVPLARGYLNDPAQTASRFVADPFGPAGGRLYRTGDLGRYRDDGQIEFLGRADNQVKIGGVRIEPEEVEATLGRHPAVSQATVVAARDRLGTAYLAAFYAAGLAAGPDADGTDLLDWLRGRLPVHMMPRRCTRLSALPLMPSGKTDRKALTALAERDERERAGQPSGQGAYVPPRGETQEQVAAAWAEIFGTDRVGADDNFFDLGGHSILLVKAQTRLRARLGRDVPVLDLFSHPTVASLADYLDRPAETGGRQALEIILPLRTEGDLPPLFCLHPAAGLSWPFAGLRQHLDGRRPLYGIQARGMARPRRPASSMADLAAEYVDQMRQVQPHGPYHLLGWSFGGVAAHTMACQLQQAGESVALLAMLDSYPSYPWEEFSADYEQKALRSLLYMSHYDLDGLDDQPLRLARVLEIVRAHDGMLSSLDDQALSAVVNTFVNSAVLQQNASHQRFDGDLLFFTAAAERREHPLSHRDWRPYVTGAIDNHDIAREHRDLGQPEALAEIGPVLDARLRTLRK